MSSNEEDAGGDDAHDAIEVSSADEIAVCSPSGSPRSASGSAKVATDVDREEEGQEADVLERQAAEEERLLSAVAAAESHIPELLDAMDLSNLRGTKAPGEAGAKKKKDGGGGGGGEKKEDGKMTSSPGDGARAKPQAAAGAAAAGAGASPQARPKDDDDDDRSSTEEDLENLAELVPGLKTKQVEIVHSSAGGGEESPGNSHNKNATDATGDDTAAAAAAEGDDTVGSLPQTPANAPIRSQRTGGEDAARWSTKPNVPSSEIRNVDSMVVMSSNDDGDDDGDGGEGEGGAGSEAAAAVAMARIKDVALRGDGSSSGASSSKSSSESTEASDSSMETMQKDGDEGEEQELHGFEAAVVGGGDGEDKAAPAGAAAAAATRARRSPDSDAKRPSKKSSDRDRKPPAAHDFEVGEYRPGKEPQMPGGLDNADYGNVGMSSGASLSTATQTHEVRMPMYLPTFKPATGCTNASDFIVRCFVARLRSGITVVKHGRSRWCKSRLRILHVHSDGRSLSWKPALGEPSSSKRPPKLDLSTCTEVRHAWSPDPLNPMFTGTPILRQKCEAANAHKSFALIFPKRTVDITAITADQCKVLMEGFSALCFRLQVANLAGRGKRGEGEEDRQTVKSDTVSNTNTSATNKSTNISPSDGGKRSKGRR